MSVQSSNSSTTDHSDLRNFLKIQFEEVQMLQAIYYNVKELVIEESILKQVGEFIEELTTEVPPLIEFVINLTLHKCLIEVEISLPRMYPVIKPEITIRSNQLYKQKQINQINADLSAYVERLDSGLICIGESISWVTENWLKYYVIENEVKNSQIEKKCNLFFTRYWIYSHHIYSKEKRKNIISWAQQFSVSGFCLSGKPGIICGEGLKEDCEEWWRRIRNMNWQKIMCKKVEDTSCDDHGDVDRFRKFENFAEISFQSTTNNPREHHADMGEFYRFLLEHDCGHIFKDYFGIEGKVPNSHH